MKTGKKLLIVLGSIVAVMAIVAGSVLGTIAYMTSASKVSNVFTIGNVKLLLDEGKVDADGQLLTGESAARTDNNSYKLIPGKSYDKDPTITVDPTTEICYIFLVTRNQITAIEDKTDSEHKPTMAQQMVANGWGIYKDTTAGSRVWIYCGSPANVDEETMNAKTPVAICGTSVGTSSAIQKEKINVFSNFHIASTATETLSIYSGAEVTINAIGIQADSFGEFGAMTSVDAAWAAVVNQFPYIQDNVNGNNNGGQTGDQNGQQ